MDRIEVEKALRRGTSASKWLAMLHRTHSDEYDYLFLAQMIDPTVTFAQFDHAWQYRPVMLESKAETRCQFISLMGEIGYPVGRGGSGLPRP